MSPRTHDDEQAAKAYVGRRVAGRVAPVEPAAPIARIVTPEPLVVEPAPAAEALVGPVAPVATPSGTSTATGTHHFNDLDLTAELPLVRAAASGTPGKRRAVKHVGSRGPLFRGLPSPPILLGVAVLAVAVGGAIATTDSPALAGSSTATQVRAANALTGSSGIGSVDNTRGNTASRDSSREALQQATGSELSDIAEQQAVEYNAKLGELAQQAQQQADELADNRWVAPLEPIVLTARFGDYGLWASYHTGLDFNGETGDPITSMAPGTVTFAGYDGSYGNKTVVTLEDGTELWYCHQTTQYVAVGDSVGAGEVIGTVGATGNVTGSHLHVEVRPGGGDPVDPYPAIEMHGVDLP